MHTEFRVGLDKATSLNSPSLLPEEIDVFLNNAIERFISQRMYGNNPRKEGFEEDQKRFDDLLTLISNALIVPSVAVPNNKPQGRSVTLPSDYWHIIEEDALVTFLDCNGATKQITVPVIPITHDRYNKIIRDPFHKPNENKVIRLGLTSNPEIITASNVTLNLYNLRYIRKPISVQYGSTYTPPVADINSDLPESVHKEIVKMAITEALGNIESQRVIIANQELQQIE